MIQHPAVNQAITYILYHITEDLRIDTIAHHCHISKYHLSRIFKAETGESIHTFIKRMKMERSAFRLKVDPDTSITDISTWFGYSSSNYSTNFKQHHEISPIQFRRSFPNTPLHNPIFPNTNSLESFLHCDKKITVEHIQEIPILYERNIGNYLDLGTQWDQFLHKHQQLITKDTLLIERTYDDPSITNVQTCLYDICISCPQSSQEYFHEYIESGLYAIYHFKGDVSTLPTAFQTIFQVWIPNSPYTIDTRYNFEIYRSIQASYMEIDLYIPIQHKIRSL